jgi:hypothetical protein
LTRYHGPVAGDSDRWVEVWKGDDPAVPGRMLDAAGIEMRLAGSMGHGGLGFLSIFRKPVSARLLVRAVDRDRARAVLRAPKEPARGKS